MAPFSRLSKHPSHRARLLHPRRDIPLPVQHTPNIDVVRVFDVEHKVRVARQRPCAQAWQVEFMGIARRSRSRVSTDVAVALLQGIDEAESHGLTRLHQVVGENPVHIPVGLGTRDNWLGLHALAVGLVDLRTRPLRLSK